MGRPREFDRAEALLKAVDVFWEKGYEATSIQDLVDRMGIHRASLYDTYGNKHELFAEAMSRYTVLEHQAAIAQLTAEGPVRDVLTAFFGSIVERISQPDDRGCLMIKAAMSNSSSNGSRNGMSGRLVSEHFKMVDSALRSCLARGKKQGDIRPDTDIDSLTKFLRSSLEGLFVSAATGMKRQSLLDIARWTVSTVN